MFDHTFAQIEEYCLKRQVIEGLNLEAAQDGALTHTARVGYFDRAKQHHEIALKMSKLGEENKSTQGARELN